MSGVWARWAAWCARDEDARGQAWARVAVLVIAILQQLRVGTDGLVGLVYVPFEDGGLARQVADTYVLDTLFGAHGGPIAWGVTLVAFTLALLGVAPRWMMLLGALSWAQLGHLYSPGDRAIDRILRFALVALALGAVPPLRGGPARVRTWPADLVRMQLVLVYMGAGFAKLGSTPEWLAPGALPPLYRAVSDPLSGGVDPVAAAAWMPLWALAGRVTVVLELVAPLLFTRWAPWWAVVGAGMHLGIAAFMDLGWFPWGMLALYPLLFQRWIARRPR